MITIFSRNWLGLAFACPSLAVKKVRDEKEVLK